MAVRDSRTLIGDASCTDLPRPPLPSTSSTLSLFFSYLHLPLLAVSLFILFKASSWLTFVHLPSLLVLFDLNSHNAEVGSIWVRHNLSLLSGHHIASSLQPDTKYYAHLKILSTEHSAPLIYGSNSSTAESLPPSAPPSLNTAPMLSIPSQSPSRDPIRSPHSLLRIFSGEICLSPMLKLRHSISH